MAAVSLDTVRGAAERLRNIVHRTPVQTCEFFDALSERKLLFKCELFQKTGSFKARGILNAVLECRDKGTLGVVTHSSGNAGQALAWAGRSAGLDAVVVVPRDAPAVKKAAIEGYGATLVMVEPTNAAREQGAAKIVSERGFTLVHPSNDPAVISGQGTVGLELVEQARSHWGGIDLDAVIVPIGGGGLIGGVATAVKGLLPNCKVIAAEPANADDAYRSKLAGQLLPHDHPPNTIADGLKTTLGSNTFPIVQNLVDDIFLVSEKEIASATRAVWERMKLAIEPSAGVGVAVAVSEDFAKKYPDLKRVGIVLCGGNCDLATVGAILAQADPIDVAHRGQKRKIVGSQSEVA